MNEVLTPSQQDSAEAERLLNIFKEKGLLAEMSRLSVSVIIILSELKFPFEDIERLEFDSPGADFTVCKVWLFEKDSPLEIFKMPKKRTLQ